MTASTVTVGGHFPLTGPAAPGYSEIPRAIDAYFQYVNAHGGVNGRKLKMIVRDDGYNPTNTVKVTKQLVLQDKIFAMLGGLGTPTHTKVVDFLNASRVPDLFVSSGCLCWNDPKAHPETFGWQPDYTVEGKILGQYIAENFKGKKVAYFLQNDDFGSDGAKGLDKYIPRAQVVDRETYEPGNTDIGPQMAKIKASGAQVLAMFTIPAYTALASSPALKLNYHPQLVVSQRRLGPDHADRPAEGVLEGQGRRRPHQRHPDRRLPAADHGHVQRLDRRCSRRSTTRTSRSCPTTATSGTASGWPTRSPPRCRTRRNPTRQSIVDAVEKNKLAGPGVVPFRFSSDSHAGYAGTQLASIKDGAVVEPRASR